MLASVRLQRREYLGEDLWQWTESERRRFEPVSRLSNLEGEVLAVLLVYWDVVVGVTEVDADCPETLLST